MIISMNYLLKWKFETCFCRNTKGEKCRFEKWITWCCLHWKEWRQKSLRCLPFVKAINMCTNSETIIRSAYEHFQDLPVKLSTGCAKMDDFLRGGISTSGITEISGDSGCGKTQICLQLTLTVQYPVSQGGLNGAAVYICTEDIFPSRRLTELIKKFPSHYYREKCNNDIKFGDHIFVEHIADYGSLHECLSKRVQVLVSRKPIKLIVIDSIAGVFRGTYDSKEGNSRALDLRATGRLLHNLSFKHNIAIVCVNQVTNVVSENNTLPIPALGLAWANMVTTRLQLYRNEYRTLSVIFSPDLPNDSILFEVYDYGVRST